MEGNFVNRFQLFLRVEQKLVFLAAFPMSCVHKCRLRFFVRLVRIALSPQAPVAFTMAQLFVLVIHRWFKGSVLGFLKPNPQSPNYSKQCPLSPDSHQMNVFLGAMPLHAWKVDRFFKGFSRYRQQDDIPTAFRIFFD